jgi:hypothetical protein
MKPITERNAWTLKEFCQRNRVSKSTAYDLAKKDKLEIRKIGGKAIVTADEERRFMAALPLFKSDPLRFNRGGGRKPKVPEPEGTRAGPGRPRKPQARQATE